MRETGKVEASGKQVGAAIEVWDVETGRQRTTLTGHASGVAVPGVTRLAFSPDGRLLASYGYPVVRIWDLVNGRLVRELDLKEYLFGINVLAFSPAGGLLATAGSRRAQLWDVASGRSVSLFQGHGSDRIDGLAISPDETRLATASGREVKVWDARSGQEALTLALPGSALERGPDVVALAWTADGQRLRAALRDASVVEWDAPAKPSK
jgi:WD40 repeat protein